MIKVKNPSEPIVRLIFHTLDLKCYRRTRGYYGTVRYGITVRLDFGKKYDTELRTEFLEKVRYGTEIRYYIFRTVLFPYSSNARFALLLPSIALFFLAYDFTPSVALAAHTTSRPHNILSNNTVNKLNCYAIIIVRLFNHNPAYSEASS